MKQLFTKLLLLSLPILLVLISVNYFGDAAKLFNDKYEKTMANYILNGSNVTNITNYDERIFQKLITKKIQKKPDLLILGSSRTLFIHSSFFNNTKMINSSVSGASIEDLIAIYQMYKLNGKLPSKIIIGIDPWTFNEQSKQNRYLSIKEYYDSFFNHDILDESKQLATYKYKELISFSYFQSSLKSLIKKIRFQSNPIETKEMFNSMDTKLSDGSLIYGKKIRNASQAEINSSIKKYIAEEIYGIANFNAISKKAYHDFELLISEIIKNKIQVEIFLTPYAPVVYEEIKSNHPLVLKTEKLIRDYAFSKKIKIHGSFNPALVGLDETFFYDGMHCKESGLQKILKNSAN